MKKIGFVVLLLLLSGCTKESSYTLNPGTDTIEVNTSFELADCILHLGENDYTMEVLNNPVNTETIGIYDVEYIYEINSETYRCHRVVHVVDQTPPTMTLIAGVDTVVVGTQWEDRGVFVSDNYDTAITYTTTGTVNVLQAGVYEIVYTAIDSSLNETSISRFVYVIE